MKECVQCGKNFVSARSHQKYCTAKCRSLAQYYRERETNRAAKAEKQKYALSSRDQMRTKIFSRTKLDANGCWIWQGCTVQDSYGRIRCGSQVRFAHRVSYTVFVGPIPDGLNVLHSCDVPACCNPNHLRVGTHAENMADCVARNRTTIGERSGRAKLTETQVIEIRKRYAAGDISSRKLAALYGVNPATLLSLVSRKTWKHV